MAIEKITKRSGEVVDFDPGKIERAIHKAFMADRPDVPESAVQEVAADSVTEIEQHFDQELMPNVEDIQDMVERQIAGHGYFDVAKSYILYRYKRIEKRAEQQAQILEKVKTQELKVTKRDGSVASFDVSEITSLLVDAAGEHRKKIEIDAIINEAMGNMYDGISTSEINQAVVMALKARIERDPLYSEVAARFLFNDIYKQVLGKTEFEDGFMADHQAGFVQSIKNGVVAKRLDERMLSFDLVSLSQKIDTKRDSLFGYIGAQVLYDRYFLKDLEQNLLEVPQYFWMRVAMGLALEEENKEERALEFYDVLSTLKYVTSTPTLFHAGTTHPQMSSCYLTTVTDDLGHIFKSYGDNAQLSKWSGGLGNDWTNVRATGAQIKSTNVGSQGVIPFLKIADATTAAINRSGKRRGATCVYLETWHLDIEDFLELRKNTGDERRRTHDMNTANWIPDLFMKRVMADQDWTLFSPDETPDLHDSYGRDFEQKYEAYEQAAAEGKIHLHKTVRAKDLWRKMVTMLFETGHPWMTFKDPCNVRSPQDHVGVVHSSNLCTEITLNTSVDETAVCNLGSVNLVRHVTNGVLDKERLAKTVKTALRMLDNVIDLNFYPTQEAENANRRHRPVGLGLMGLQDALYALNVNFDSEEAVMLSDEVMEFISYHAILTSSELAKERGTYESYRGSKWDRGLFPVDTLRLLEEERGVKTGLPLTGKMDWTPVREHVARHGMRNSNTMAIAPTATIANISGVFPSIEPIYKNVYVKSNFSGDFTTNNGYLVKDLKERGLWNEELLEKLKHYDGTVQPIEEIPADLKAKYKEVFEIEPIWILRHAAHRGKWIDQSQSINLFISSTSGKIISDAYLDAWRLGLKTTYYLRSLGASAIEKSTLDVTKKFDQGTPAPVADATPTPEPTAGVSVDRAPATPAAPAQPTTPTPAIPKPARVFVAEDAICEACE